jgi:hypothetical protein
MDYSFCIDGTSSEIYQIGQEVRVIFGALITIGGNANIIWEFGAGVLVVYVFGAMLVTGIQAIKEFLNQ